MNAINHVQHFYAATAHAASVTDASAAGTLTFKKNVEDGSFYMLIKGADTVLASDIIPKGSVTAKVSKAIPPILKKYTVTSTANPVANTTYIVRMMVKQYFSQSDDDKQYFFAEATATAGMTKTQLYAKLVESANLNFKNELTPLFKFSSSAAGFVIEELEQPWKLGKIRRVPVYVDLSLTNSNDEVWGSIAKGVSATILKNGKEIADLEFDSMGERGDYYRQFGYPYNIDTEYLIDPTKNYSTITLHFYWEGNAENVQKSPKTLVMAIPDGTGGDDTYTAINKIINELEKVSGLTLADLT